ncbi:YceI family protein [Acinetobacter ursingii]|uniref:YceI family protein n=1 Tax=Acinetobacter ursingii TaxID=108980 RepID=UPI0005C8BE74|nr:YceI family protein [Acinetobacter ursingii]MCU4480783.1 YceI family protein [Acinetobacter ursingii]MCU4505112.1 YceI family protein [Acinetobacter ursingii]MCU4569798.1 YceI family protein [Acinetobacter ursingii]
MMTVIANQRLAKSLWIGALIVVSMSQVHAANWVLAPTSNVGFHIDSARESMVIAKFNTVHATLNFDENAPQQASTRFIMDVDSLSLNNPAMKSTLLGKDLFYAAQFKTVSFKSDQFRVLGNNKYQILGQLTIRGITRPVIFDSTLKPVTNNQKLMNMVSSTTINRADFGMKKAPDGMGEKINIKMNVDWKVKR